ncbi:hypothetical protein [Aquabacterium sp.]|uniref:hypothetical protein n=1 Tax=Aquabacterium sp. TaxID=1872578 RepID=UPI002C87C8FD|nr:hypothetical protein [Aquabacterium sp.]HSW03450.1 hypothetical protein [Aquabacterium sp.]
MLARTLCAAAALMLCAAADACPTDPAPRAAGIVLSIQPAGRPARPFSAADLAALPQTTLTQRQSVSSTGGTATERSLSYGGVLLRDALTTSGFDATTDRSARTAVIEAVATDGYRAVFSWGELFNNPVGEQVLVITTLDGKPLDAAAGPVALRSLADLRPGPRHVRNLCALLVRGL